MPVLKMFNKKEMSSTSPTPSRDQSDSLQHPWDISHLRWKVWSFCIWRKTPKTINLKQGVCMKTPSSLGYPNFIWKKTMIYFSWTISSFFYHIACGTKTIRTTSKLLVYCSFKFFHPFFLLRFLTPLTQGASQKDLLNSKDSGCSGDSACSTGL